MKVIYKYRLPFMEVARVEMHSEARILRVAGENGAIYIWALVDTKKPLVSREFYLYKTGGETRRDIDNAVYHGCGAIFIQMELMMYVFEFVGESEFPVTPTPKVDIKKLYEDEAKWITT